DLVAVLPDRPAVVPAVDRALNGAVMSTLVVVWRVSEACNLACGFCGYSREVLRPRASANEGQVRALGAALGAYGRAQGREVLVSWLGGEPFLWRPLLGVSRYFNGELGLQVAVTTNGIA